TNKIVKVDWGGIERITSNGNKSKIKIEIFRQAVNQLFRTGKITREEINLDYSKRASSGIVLILSQVPDFVLTSNPIGLRLKSKL
ncbi:MAG TPA: restriction endonuclease, partial [Bacteroidia bacterium]|nr:restriction endonuclease [Bacteroidia bacterium]